VKLRELSGLSQSELAERIESSTASVSRWENGVITPKRGKAEQLDRALNAEGRLVRVWEPVATGLQVPPWMRSKGALEEKAVEIDTVTVSTWYPGCSNPFPTRAWCSGPVAPVHPTTRWSISLSCASRAMKYSNERTIRSSPRSSPSLR